MLHIPILRQGVPYRSLDVARTPHHRTREPFVEVSQANAGLIRRDVNDQQTPRKALEAFSTVELIRICRQAAEHFLNGRLLVGDDVQSPEDYVQQTSATTGLPYVLVRRNMRKIHGVLAEMESVLRGLTRGLDLTVLDRGWGYIEGQTVSFCRRSQALGVVLPNNSPGVHSLWLPAFAMKTALVLKPGSAEPWTPYRIIQALIAAGAPREAFGYYPADHGGSGEILRCCGRGMVFGDVTSTRVWQNDPRIEVHGPGYSKIVLGKDVVDRWEDYLDVMVTSILENSGRSCVNASGVWVPGHAKKIAEALALRLVRVAPRAADDEEAELAPFADRSVARRISAMIDSGLGQEGALDVTDQYRQGGRLAEWNESTYLLPTIVRCGPEHALANREFLFPFASVVEIDEQEIPEALGPTLVVTAITEDMELRRRLLNSPLVGRLNFGAIPTNHIRWDQPHEGNLFDHLYARRAFQVAS